MGLTSLDMPFLGGYLGAVDFRPLTATAKWLLVHLGQSNKLGLQATGSVTNYSGITTPDSRVLVHNRNSSSAAGTSFVEEGGTAAAGAGLPNGPRTVNVGGPYVIGMAGPDLVQMHELADRTSHTWFGAKHAIDGVSLANLVSPSYPVGAPPSMLTQIITYTTQRMAVHGITDPSKVIFDLAQGEGDIGGTYATYLANLGTFVTALRVAFPGSWFGLLRLSNRNDLAGNVRSAQESFISTLANAYIYDADDQPLRDAAHYTDDAYTIVGIRAADAVIGAISGATPQAPRHIATGPFTIAAAAAASTPTMPLHKAGDILIFWVAALGQTNYALSPAQGFVEGTASPQHNSGNSLNSRAQYFWCRADQTTMDANGGQMPAPTMPDVASDDFKVSAIGVIRGCVASGDPVATAVGQNVASGTAITFPSLTGVPANSLIVYYIAGRFDPVTPATEVDGWTHASLTNFREHIDKSTNSGVGYSMAMAAGYTAAGGSIAGATATFAHATDSSQFAIAFKSA